MAEIITVEAHRRLRKEILLAIACRGSEDKIEVALDGLEALDIRRQGWDTPDGIYIQRHIEWLNRMFEEHQKEIADLKALLPRTGDEHE